MLGRVFDQLHRRAAGRARSSRSSGAARSSCANQAWKVRISTARPAASTRSCSAAERRRQRLARAPASSAALRAAPRTRSSCVARGAANVAQPVVSRCAHLAGGLAREGDRQDLVRLARRRAARAAMRETSIQVLPAPAQASTTHAAARIAGHRVERFARSTGAPSSAIAPAARVMASRPFRGSAQWSRRHRPRASQKSQACAVAQRRQGAPARSAPQLGARPSTRTRALRLDVAMLDDLDAARSVERQVAGAERLAGIACRRISAA